jgi:hypothetical protein
MQKRLSAQGEIADRVGILTLSNGPANPAAMVEHPEPSVSAPVPMTLTRPLCKGWRVLYVLQPQGDRMTLGSLTIEPDGELPAGGLTSTVLRQVHVKPIRLLAANIIETPPSDAPEKDFTRPDKPGRPREIPMSFYKQVAETYTALLYADARSAAKRMAEQTIDPKTGKPYKRDTMRSLLRRCRRMGLCRLSMPVPSGTMSFGKHAPTVVIGTAPKNPTRKRKAKS